MLHAYEWWGVASGVAYAIALWPMARRAGIGWWDYWKIGIVTCAALYMGSRLFYEIAEFPFMPGRMWVDAEPLWLRIWLPRGFTFLGGVAALAPAHLGLGATGLVKTRPGRVLDALAPVTALGFAVSKVGCLAAGCCHGRPVDAWWGMRVIGMAAGSAERAFPLPVVEMAVSLAIGAAALAVLARAPASWKLRDGAVFAGYVTAASLARFALGFMRGGYEVSLGPLSTVQWGALAMAVAGLAALAALARPRKATAGTR